MGLRSDPIQGITTPDGAAIPDMAGATASMVDQVVDQISMRFTTATDRDTKIPAASRKAGMISYLNTTGQLETVLVDAGSWVPLATRDVFVGEEGLFLGAVAPAGVLKIRKDLTTVVTTNASGGFGVNYPGGAFPNGISTVLATPADTTGNMGMVVPILVNCTLAAFNGIVYKFDGTGGVVTQTVRINISAVGW